MLTACYIINKLTANWIGLGFIVGFYPNVQFILHMRTIHVYLYVCTLCTCIVCILKAFTNFTWFQVFILDYIITVVLVKQIICCFNSVVWKRTPNTGGSCVILYFSTSHALLLIRMVFQVSQLFFCF